MVSRYAFDGVEEYNPQGDWVSASDYDALAAENQALRERAEAAEKDEEEAYQIGLRDGYEKGVQDADERTGGDGEYVCCVGDDPDDRHCPTPQHMLQRMADRWDAARRAEAAAWNDAIEAAAVEAEEWDTFGPTVRAIRALRRAAPTEGEA